MNIDERTLQIRDGCEDSSAEGRLSEWDGHILLLRRVATGERSVTLNPAVS